MLRSLRGRRRGPVQCGDERIEVENLSLILSGLGNAAEQETTQRADICDGEGNGAIREKAERCGEEACCGATWARTRRVEYVGVRNGMDRPSGVWRTSSERGREARAKGKSVKHVVFQHVDIHEVADGVSRQSRWRFDERWRVSARSVGWAMRVYQWREPARLRW